MVTATILICLGVLTQVVVLATTRNNSTTFNRACQTCGYHIPAMDRSPSFFDCPECQRLMNMGVNLNDRLPRR